MMKDILINVSRQTRLIYLTDTTIGVDNENLQAKLVFKFTDEFVNGTARLEYILDGEKHWFLLEKEGESYTCPLKNVLLKEGRIDMQLVITESETEAGIPVFKSNMFYVRVNNAINAESEAPEGYEQWLDIANAKLAEIDEAINDANEAGNYATVQGNYAKETADELLEAAEEGRFDGKDGKDALINGVNTLTVQGGTNIETTQVDGVLTINNTYTYDDTLITQEIASLTEIVEENTKDITNVDNRVVGLEEELQEQEQSLNHLADTKQDNLVSGENIKTINNQSILGSGNITIQGGGSSNYNDLENRPLVNDILLEGNLTSHDLGLLDEQDVENIIDSKTIDFAKKSEIPTKTSELENDNNFISEIPSEYVTETKLESMKYNYVKDGVVNNTNELTDEEQLKIEQWLGLEQNYITFSNTKAYTPTEDYNPTTKKYVDDTDNYLKNRISEIELSKFPNVTIFGSPTIQQGQVSGFTKNDYLEFPFLVDFRGNPFEINFAFTTGTNVDLQQNILDSDFGLAFAIRNKHLVMALSFNGTSWATEQTGTLTLQPQTSYRIKITWNRLLYKVQYSVDGGNTYIDDITFGSTQSPYPKLMYIGIGKLADNYFEGIINLNYADVYVAGNKIWMGMDDAGLALRADINLQNITTEGEQRIKDLSKEELTDYVKNTDYATYSKGGVIKVGTYGTEMSSAGVIRGTEFSLTDYGTSSNRLIICKGTLENVLSDRLGNIETLLSDIDTGSGV